MTSKNEITALLQKYIDEQAAKGIVPTLNDLNRELGGVVMSYNQAPMPEFNGFSPEQMTRMINTPFGLNCPVGFNYLTDEQLRQIPIMRQALHLLHTLEKGELKLTAQGYIPIKLVGELYEMGTHNWGTDYYKQKTELRVEHVRVLRFTLIDCGYVKTKNGKMSLTANGLKILKDPNTLLQNMMKYLFIQYNTGYFDRIDNLKIANVGRLYSLWMIHHFGAKWRRFTFYGDLYTKALSIPDPDSIYGSRIFDRLFHYIGLVETRRPQIIDMDDWHNEEVIKTDLVDMIFNFLEPK